MSGVGHVRRKINLKVGQTAYQCEITNATLTPSTTVATATALCDNGVVQDTGVPVWTLDVDYLVDHKATSFYRFLIGNAGQLADYEYEPDPITAPGVLYKGKLRVTPGPAGGEAGSFESGSVSLPIEGTPAITDPVAPAPPEE
jgi:hypothetical protein